MTTILGLCDALWAGDQLPLPQEHGLGDQACSPLSGIREEPSSRPGRIVPRSRASELGLLHPFINEISHEIGTYWPGFRSGELMDRTATIRTLVIHYCKGWHRHHDSAYFVVHSPSFYFITSPFSPKSICLSEHVSRSVFWWGWTVDLPTNHKNLFPFQTGFAS